MIRILRLVSFCCSLATLAGASEHAPAPAQSPAPTPAEAKANEPEATPAVAAPAHTAAPVPNKESEPATPVVDQAKSASAAAAAKEAEAGTPLAAPSEESQQSKTPTLNRVQRLTAEQSEIASLIRLGAAKTETGDLESASIAYRQLFARPLTVEQQRASLLGFARMLRKKGELTKAAAVYEKIIKDYIPDEDAPEIFLELGRTQRALGAYKSAINRFYSVINSTLKLPESGASRYRQLAKTAQFEIAETHFQAGAYQEASRFYSRLRLLDLAPVDRARAYFKSAYALFLAEDYNNAVTSLRAFLDQHPDDENVPESRYLLAISYRRLQRPLEALAEALELLRTERSRTSKDPKRWIYWQRKTGNQIANEFYDQGDIANALAVYTTLADISPEPIWHLPLVYQIGLCYERLGQTEQAITQFQSILDSARAPKGDDVARPDMTDLVRMAKWRLEQINWHQRTEQRLLVILPQQRTVQATPTPRHDASGNAAKTPTVVR